MLGKLKNSIEITSIIDTNKYKLMCLSADIPYLPTDDEMDAGSECFVIDKKETLYYSAKYKTWRRSLDADTDTVLTDLELTDDNYLYINLVPEFNAVNQGYRAKVTDIDIENGVTVSATAAEGVEVSIECNDETYDSGDAIELEDGDNLIKVIADDGADTVTIYNVLINKERAEGFKALSFASGDSYSYLELIPDIPGIAYPRTANMLIEGITVTKIRESDKIEGWCNGHELDFETTGFSASAEYVPDKVNELVIRITDTKTGKASNYKFEVSYFNSKISTVQFQKARNADDSGNYDPTWSKTTTEYTAHCDYDTDKIAVVFEEGTDDRSAFIKINDADPVEYTEATNITYDEGENTIEVQIADENGEKQITYTFTVTHTPVSAE